MFDAIISGIGKIKKANDLKSLRDGGDLSFDEFSTMKYLLMYGRGESVEFEYFRRNKSSIESSLNDFWEGKTDSEDYFAERHVPEPEVLTVRFAKNLGARPENIDQTIKPSKVKQEQKYWGFKITKDFMNSVKKIDKNLQGRILQALLQISLNPNTIMGDTNKPLTSDLEGYWRYRIGSYRLIYKPVGKWSEILLISFAARGSVY